MRCPFCRAENDDTTEICFSCGRGLFALTQGSVVASRYEILATLGQGGMGTVYKAHDRDLDETVALKVLRGDFTEHPEIAKRFRSEIKLARRIRHRNVCGIHEYGQDGHLRYIAMEFIDGVDFRRVLRTRGALPLPEAFDVSIQVAEGLQAIHDEGIVHRDLKTPNIMRDGRGLVRLMDFGIAKEWESHSGASLTGLGQILGTPEYMSPEQARGDKVDFRSDIYALGVVTFELFTGDVPFRGDTPVVTLLLQINEAPPLEGPRSARLPRDLIPVLRMALAKRPGERHRSAREMAQALREAQRATAPRLPAAQPIRTATAPAASPEAVVLSAPTSVPTQVPTLPLPGASAEAPTKDAALTPAPPRVPRARPAHASGGATPRTAYWRSATLVASTTLAVVVGALWIGQRPHGAPATAPTPAEAAAASPAPAQSPAVAASRSAAVPQSPTPAAARRAAVERAAPTPGERPGRREARVPVVVPTPSTRPSPPSLPAARREAETSSASGRARAPGAAAPSSAASVPAPVPAAVQPTAPAPSQPAADATSAAALATGFLQLAVRPYADVIVDGSPLGTTPLKTLRLTVGAHSVRLVNPDYQPFKRTVTIRPGETMKLEVDFPLDGIPK
jgi:serine/threonine protein kinase